LNPPTAKTVRELRLETLLAATVPLLWERELGTKTDPKIRALIDLIKRELRGN
jgi:hypothetical protein